MCGIFAYLNYNVPRERRIILEILFNGLRRLEYRGYDSAGISIDSDPVISKEESGVPTDGEGKFRQGRSAAPPLVFRSEGKIEKLVTSVYQGTTLVADHASVWLKHLNGWVCFQRTTSLGSLRISTVRAAGFHSQGSLFV